MRTQSNLRQVFFYLVAENDSNYVGAYMDIAAALEQDFRAKLAAGATQESLPLSRDLWMRFFAAEYRGFDRKTRRVELARAGRVFDLVLRTVLAQCASR
jgi:hypothetical protein